MRGSRPSKYHKIDLLFGRYGGKPYIPPDIVYCIQYNGFHHALFSVCSAKTSSTVLAAYLVDFWAVLPTSCIPKVLQTYILALLLFRFWLNRICEVYYLSLEIFFFLQGWFLRQCSITKIFSFSNVEILATLILRSRMKKK